MNALEGKVHKQVLKVIVEEILDSHDYIVKDGAFEQYYGEEHNNIDRFRAAVARLNTFVCDVEIATATDRGVYD